MCPHPPIYSKAITVEAVSIENDSFNNSSSKFVDLLRIIIAVTTDGAFGGAVFVVGKKGGKVSTQFELIDVV
jgi:hypothetical protein